MLVKMGETSSPKKYFNQDNFLGFIGFTPPPVEWKGFQRSEFPGPLKEVVGIGDM